MGGGLKDAENNRRGPPRTPSKPKIDDDLVELALMLDEQRVDNNAAGWFGPPWKNGLCAARLALAIAQRRIENQFVAEAQNALTHMIAVGEVNGRVDTGPNYFTADEYMQQDILLHENMLKAGFRCYQVWAANSDGGGIVYNQILQPNFERLLPEDVEKAVAALRCDDALGRYHPKDERRRKAFAIAWRRGLFRAAYALGAK